MNEQTIKLITQAGIGVLAIGALCFQMYLTHLRDKESLEALTKQADALQQIADVYTGQ